MYGPASAPGMRTRNVSILKYLFKPKKPSNAEIWQPEDEEEEGELGEGRTGSMASEILPEILERIPKLKSQDVGESAEAAQEIVSLTNSTSNEEDKLIGKTGVIEVLAQIMMKGSDAGRLSSANAIANLVANCESNKILLCNIPGSLSALVSLASVSDKGASVVARAMLNLVANKELAVAVCRTAGALETVAGLVLKGHMSTKEDAAHVLHIVISQGKDNAVMVANTENALQALKSAARADNCTDEARLWSISALQGLSRCSKLRISLLRSKIIEDVCVPLLSQQDTAGAWQEAIQTLAVITAANLTGWCEDTVLVNHREEVAKLVHVMAMALTSREFGSYKFKNSQVLLALWSLSPNDSFKSELVKAKLLELCIDMIALAESPETSGPHKGMNLHMLLEMVYHFMFLEAGAAKFKELQGKTILESIARRADPLARKLARGALWQMGYRDVCPQQEAGNHLFVSFSKEDEGRVRQLVRALNSKGLSTILSGERMQADGKKNGKKESHLYAMSRGISSAAAVLVCISESYNISAACRTEAQYAEEVGATVIPLLLDDSKPAKHLANIASLLDCIDATDPSSLDLVVMEITEELKLQGKATGDGQGQAWNGFNGGPPTMAMTNLRGDKATADEEEEPRDQSHAHVTIPDAVSSPWSAYDSSFMRGAQMDDSLQSSRGRSDWEGEGEGESYGFSRHAAFPVEMLEGFVAKIVSERTVKLQARISFLEDENKLIRSELESLKNLHLAAKKETSREDPLASAERQLTSQPPLLNGHVVDKSSDLMPVMHSEEKSQGEEFVGGCEENEDPKVGLQELAQEQKEQEQESSS